MRLIDCTQKLFKELAVVPTDPDVVQTGSEGLANWYANLLRFNRRKCILFTNEKTLYSRLIPGVLKKDLLNIDNLFVSHIGYNLQYEGFGTVVRNEFWSVTCLPIRMSVIIMFPAAMTVPSPTLTKGDI